MKSLIFLFTLCVLGQFIDGQRIKKNLNIGRGSEDKDNDETGKESAESQGNEGEPVSQQSEENASKKNQEDSTSESTESSRNELEQNQTPSGTPEDERRKKQFEETMKRFKSEMEAGDTADLIGQNPHIKQDHIYNDLGRRFVPQYKYTEALKDIPVAVEDNELVPEKAPPELVLVVAKESALLGPDKPMTMDKKSLRSGDYWNGVWKEDVNVKSSLRSSAPTKKVLGSIKAEIKPGSEFYKVVVRMKKISPRLLYIINKKQV